MVTESIDLLPYVGDFGPEGDLGPNGNNVNRLPEFGDLEKEKRSRKALIEGRPTEDLIFGLVALEPDEPGRLAAFDDTRDVSLAEGEGFTELVLGLGENAITGTVEEIDKLFLPRFGCGMPLDLS